MAWLKAGELAGNEPVYQDRQDFQLIRLKKDGLYMYVNSCIPDKMKDSVVALGSGSNVALYAMKYLKKTPAVAVRESIKVSPGCGGNVDIMRLK